MYEDDENDLEANIGSEKKKDSVSRRLYSLGNDLQFDEIIRQNEIQLQIIQANHELDESDSMLLPSIRGKRTNRGDDTDRKWLQELNQ